MLEGIIVKENQYGDVCYFTCPACKEIGDEGDFVSGDYHTVYEIGENIPYEGLTGYVYCPSKCSCVYILDPFNPLKKLDTNDVPVELLRRIDTLEEAVARQRGITATSHTDYDFYSVTYAKVKEFVNGRLMDLTCDHKLSADKIKEILVSSNEDTLKKYGVKEEETDFPDTDDPEVREKKFNLGYPVNSYNPFSVRSSWFHVDHDGIDNLLKCISADGREFDFILSGD